jgi:hypothetical protein
MADIDDWAEFSRKRATRRVPAARTQVGIIAVRGEHFAAAWGWKTSEEHKLDEERDLAVDDSAADPLGEALAQDWRLAIVHQVGNAVLAAELPPHGKPATVSNFSCGVLLKESPRIRRTATVQRFAPALLSRDDSVWVPPRSFTPPDHLVPLKDVPRDVMVYQL